MIETVTSYHKFLLSTSNFKIVYKICQKMLNRTELTFTCIPLPPNSMMEVLTYNKETQSKHQKQETN